MEEIQIRNYIIECLCTKGITTKEIKQNLKKNGISVSNELLKEIFESIKSILNVSVVGITPNGPLYQIEEPLLQENKIFPIEIKDSTEFLDIMYTADYHIGANTPHFKEEYNAMLTYCEDKDISTIINLGDFFDFSVPGKIYTLERYQEMLDIVNDLIEKMPNLKGMYQAVLGGNHDVWNNYFGMDFLNYFITHRPDFISLGNKRATLQINRNGKNLANFLLVHYNQALQKKDLASRVTSYYSENKTLKDRYTCAFFGHSHATYLDTSCGAFAVNSLSRGCVSNGAMHTRLYFNEEGLDYLSLKPIVLERKKVASYSEIIFRK